MDEDTLLTNYKVALSSLVSAKAALEAAKSLANLDKPQAAYESAREGMLTAEGDLRSFYTAQAASEATSSTTVVTADSTSSTTAVAADTSTITININPTSDATTTVTTS